MPYSGEHACRLVDPSRPHDKVARKNCGRRHNGKCIDIIYYIYGNKPFVQALRYPVEVWTESSARAHCTRHRGSFTPAKKED